MGFISAARGLLKERITQEEAKNRARENFNQAMNYSNAQAENVLQQPIIPANPAERTTLQRAGFVPYEGYMDLQTPEGVMNVPAEDAYVSPARRMLDTNTEYFNAKAQKALDERLEYLGNPVNTVIDTLADVANNTVGLPLKLLSGGQNPFGDPSQKSERRYEQALRDTQSLHATAQEVYFQNRDARTKTFSDILKGGVQDPSAVREFEYFSNLTPEKKRTFMNIKRGSRTVDLGDRKVTLDASGNLVDEYGIKLSPSQELDYLANASRVQSGGTTAGKFIAEAKTLYPTMNEKQKELEKTVKYIKGHKGLDAGTGLSSYLDLSNYTPGSDAYNFRAYAKQAQGKVFEAAYDSLKGGGTITEFETQAMADAMARMDTATSKEEYLKAVDDFVAAQKRGVELVKIASKSTDLDDYLDNYKIYEVRQRGGSTGGTGNANNSGGTITLPSGAQITVERD